MTDDRTTEEVETIDEGEETPPRALPAHPVLRGLVESFTDVEWRLSGDQDTVVVAAGDLREFAAAARSAGFEMVVDVTAVDHLRKRRIRFELVVGLLSLEHNIRLRLLVPVAADEPIVPSLVPVYPGANFFEREVYDMFGITFTDHPDLTRILMPDDWIGYPLRKDFGSGAVPVQFKSSPKAT